MVTIKQIAEIAGVSRGTVDRVLNNRGHVNRETADRIRSIASSLNYVPNKAAKSLAALKRGIKLGYIILSQGDNPFFGQLESGIREKAQELQEYGVSLSIEYGDYSSPEYQDELIDKLVNNGIDGLAICGFNFQSTAEKLRSLTLCDIPVVTVNTDIPDSGRLAYVGSNYKKSGRTAGRIMEIATGGKARVGIILGSHSVLCHSERVEGFISYLNEHASGIIISNIKENHDDDYISYSIATEMLTSHDPVDAIYLASAGTLGVCKAIETVGRKHPVFLCYDRFPQIEPMLKNRVITATICQQPFYQGSKPLDILFNKIAMDIFPDKENYYTNIEILVSENM